MLSKVYVASSEKKTKLLTVILKDFDKNSFKSKDLS